MNVSKDNFLAVSLLFSALLTPFVARAGVVMGGTRVIYQEGKRGASMSVTNQDDNTPYLIQSWVENYDANNKLSVPFVVTPPLFRLDGGKENIIRISYTGTKLPEDHESVFWLDVKSISPTPKNGGNVLQVNIKSKFKLFYRPKGLTSLPDDAFKKLKFHKESGELVAYNPTPFFISFYSISLSGHEIKDPGMIAPKETKHWSLVAGNNISWQAINDYGGITEAVTSSL